MVGFYFFAKNMVNFTKTMVQNIKFCTFFNRNFKKGIDFSSI